MTCYERLDPAWQPGRRARSDDDAAGKASPEHAGGGFRHRGCGFSRRDDPDPRSMERDLAKSLVDEAGRLDRRDRGAKDSFERPALRATFRASLIPLRHCPYLPQSGGSER